MRTLGSQEIKNKKSYADMGEEWKLCRYGRGVDTRNKGMVLHEVFLFLDLLV